ncbi:MAG: MerR family DNA-binding transcriptional regulator [Coriobacteriaceae bacterium]|jgi:DNA-binding transcriptional MerR regulator|nr:MerR family DNA-binding transcriptional regulator [Coriobacteriaceae bacterium]
MEKNDLLSIKEFAELTGVKETTLRYYDKLNIFSPAVRNANGYRYYSPFQIITIKTISLLQDLDIPTKTIIEMAHNRTPESMLELLVEKTNELEEQLINVSRSYDVVKTISRIINLGLLAKGEPTKLEYLEESHIILGPKNDFSTTHDFYECFTRFCRDANLYNVDTRLPICGLWTDFDTYLESPNEPTHFFSIDPRGSQKRSAGTYVTVYSHSYYGESGGMEKQLQKFIKENKIQVKGPVYTAYLLNEISVRDPNQYLLRTAVSVA